MRARSGFFVVGCMVAVAAACARDVERPPAAPQVVERAASSAVASGPPQYLVADPAPRGASVVMALGASGTYGLVVDKARIVIGRGDPKVAPDAPDAPIANATKIPGRFGGGFLFWTDTTIYRAEAFDAPLRAIARVPDSVSTVSFASKFLLVRTRNGERWAIALPSGERKAIEPLGVADVEALDDGRSLAFNDQGTAFASTDGGEHWADVTAQVKSSPTRVAVIDGEIWLLESGGGALRLERDGHLSSFDKEPPEKPPEIRARDPKWRGQDAPLRAVFHGGAAVDDTTAIVIEQGDVVRVDVRTGEIVSIVPGRLPPDAQCEAVPTAGDVLFACVSHASSASGGGAFVVSHTLSSEAPVIEQSFAGDARFFASDDGGLAFAGPCGGSTTPSASADTTACVRSPGGTWQEHDVEPLKSDGGAGDVHVVRWVPRADGNVVAIVQQASLGIYDPRTGRLVPLPEDARELIAQSLPVPSHFGRKKKPTFRGQSLVDATWSFSASGLRGWQLHGGIVEITDEGRVHRSPYAFEVLAAGPYALGRAQDGRLFQSSDHGASWVEVAGPPSGAGGLEMRRCTTAGCDLGAFYRIGWAARPPRTDPPPRPAPAAPEVRRAAPVALACRPAGAPVVKTLPRTGSTPEDLGLGATRLPVAAENGTVAYLRTVIARAIVNPLHDGGGGVDAEVASIRAMLTGYQTTHEHDDLEVLGPNKSASSLRRPMTYVAPFDPAAKIGRAVIPMNEVIAAGRGAGMTNEDILSDDMTESGNVVLVTPTDPNAPSDIAFHNPRGLLAVVRNARTRVAMRVPQNDALVVSGAATGADEAVFLDVEASGTGHVFKVGSGGLPIDLFDISPTVNDTAYYPANPDAVAIGPKNDVAVLRTPSGSDAASAWDPAIVLQPATPPAPLAPWSQLRFADDPACKEPGWRATLQLIGPWVRVTTPELRVDELPMVARVKWNDKRVCLEGFEVKLSNVAVRIAGGAAGAEPIDVPTWLIGKNGTFARVGVTEGIEWRQPLECTIDGRSR